MRALLASLLLLVNAVEGLQLAPEVGVTGYILAPDGTPVSGGTVVAQSLIQPTMESIDSTGHFRVVPPRSGLHQFRVSVPGLPLYRFTVDIPPSRAMRLPPIRLVAGAYYRVRLVTPAGDSITAPRLRRRLFDPTGKPIVDEGGDPISDAVVSDGAVTIGPLPRAIMTLAMDTAAFAQTRLPDVSIAEATKNLDGGTVVIQQPGAILHVDIVDAAGAPVPNHDVAIEDTRARSPLAFPMVRTDQQGRATFDRLAMGRYRVSTPAVARCANVMLATTRVVSMSGNGEVELLMVAGGLATFRITSPLGPMKGVRIFASPNVPTSFRSAEASRSIFGCPGTTDENGRVTLKNFPPGPAHVTVPMTTSVYVRQINASVEGPELRIAIPDGFAQVHVVNALKNEPVSGASITWSAGGARVEATSTGAGDVLLEGVGAAGGTVSVSAQGYQPAEEQLAEPPTPGHTIALTPLPPSRNLRPRVVTTAGEPLPDAVVELISADPAAVPHFAATDANGFVRFFSVPSGSLQLIASADGFVTSTMRVADDAPPSEVLLTLARDQRR